MKLKNRFVGIPNRIKLVAKISFFMIVLMYFVFHAITGENGLRSYIVVKQKVIEQTSVLKQVKKRKEQLERRVKLLSNESLDKDLLEERCRVVLNFAMPEDIMVREKSMYD